jgi:predicted RNA-binding protein
MISNETQQNFGRLTLADRRGHNSFVIKDQGMVLRITADSDCVQVEIPDFRRINAVFVTGMVDVSDSIVIQVLGFVVDVGRPVPDAGAVKHADISV